MPFRPHGEDSESLEALPLRPGPESAAAFEQIFVRGIIFSFVRGF